MCGYQPKFTVSSKSINLISEISALVTKMDYRSLNRNLKLRKKNRVRSIQSSLQIEANSMTVEQVTDIMNGKKVLGPPRDIKEVKNAIEAYKLLPELDPYSIKDLLRTHGIMMADLTDQSGMFRTVGVNVVNSSTGEVIHYAPHPDYVPRFIEELMQWASTSEDHPLIISCVFHHEFEYIHPFTDGNGRTGRLWQNLILSKWNDLMASIPVESMIRRHQEEYYEAISRSTADGDSGVFIEFMLERTDRILDDTIAQISRESAETSEYVKRLLAAMEYDVPYTSNELLNRLGLRSKETLRKNYLNPAIGLGLLRMTLPKKPNSRNQRYVKQ